jgi:hypothetical protein
MLGAGVIPAAQCIGGSEIAQPLVDGGASLREAARPKTVDEHTLSVGPRRWIVDSLDRNRHTILLYYCKAARGAALSVSSFAAVEITAN